jgi:hypothetical protein
MQMLAMQAKLMGYKLQDAESDLATQQQSRERDARILKRLQGLQGLPTLGDDATPQTDSQSGTGSVVSPFMQRMSELGDAAPPAGKFGAQAYLDAATQAGLPNPGSMETSNAIVDRVNRLGETPDVAARALSGGGQPAQIPGMADQGTAPRSASVFAAGDGAQFAETEALLRGLARLPKLQDSATAQTGQRLPSLPPTMRQGGTAPRQNATQIAVQQMLARADIYATEGDPTSAAKIYADVAKLQPQVDKIDIAMHEGQPVRVITYKDGREEVSQFGAKPDMVGVDLGGTYEFVDKNRVQSGRVFQKTQTADSRAIDRRFATRAAGMGVGGEPSLNDATLDVLADQALRGDTSVYQNLGRGAQGAANLVALRTRVAQKAQGQGLTGGDLASINADYQGQKAGLRTSGTISARIENAASEAAELAPLAIQASRSVVRSGLLPFGKADVMFNTQTNDPAMSQFATANIGLATAYAGAMARGGKATVSDMQHAREILSTAKSQPAYEATVSQMQQEIAAAQRAPQNVRNNLRGQINGRGGSHDAPTVPNPMAPPAGQRFNMLPPAAQFDGKRMKADNGTIYVSRGGRWVKE